MRNNKVAAKSIGKSYASIPDDTITLNLLSTLLEYAGSTATAYDKAAALLTKFDNLKAILSADTGEYNKLGLDGREAAFLKLLNTFVRSYYLSLIDQSGSRYNTLAMKKYLISHYSSLPKERAVIIMYDARGALIKDTVLSIGTTNSVQINLRKLFEELLKYQATSVVIAHNHPSGTPEPSQQDRDGTVALRQDLARVEINLLDHFVIGENQLYSLASSTYI